MMKVICSKAKDCKKGECMHSEPHFKVEECELSCPDDYEATCVPLRYTAS